MSPFKHKLYASLDPLAHHFAVFICELAGSRQRSLYLGALAASLESSHQHSCADLAVLGGQAVSEGLKLRYPEGAQWQQELSQHPLVVGAPGANTPLILEGHRLYLQRYWEHEQALAQALLTRIRQPLKPQLPSPREQAAFQRCFPPQGGVTDWQAVACAAALDNRLSLIAGGPGTGKTTTVARLLHLLLSQEPELKIALAAPTGKAAMRLQQSLQLSLQKQPELNLPPALLTGATTLHRLLGTLPGQVRFRHHAQNPLDCDVLIVDEASMIDLALMRRLLEALPPEARLILLGDPHQLASVETGSVLGDICVAANPLAFGPEQQERLRTWMGQNSAEFQAAPAASLDNAVIELQVSHRFQATSALGQLARAIQAGAAQTALEILSQTDSPVQLLPLPSRWDGVVQDLLEQDYAPYWQASDPAQALAAYEKMVLLCALRRGPWGVEGLNAEIELGLRRLGLLPGPGPWYHRRPVLIGENDPTHQLYNGDIGICWREQNGAFRIWFRRSDGNLRSYAPAQLPPHETAWALTVHKSQGSEFQKVLLILPDQVHPLVSRELIYTAITRARQEVRICSPHTVLIAGLQKQIQRASGLAAKLKHA